ncbi:PREDICTED: sodium-dependent lysophosphatidylcholine symporter 1-B-like isoform X1 [Haliaeetus leucocephalus]|uniref:sodium-dependent lysophosphatidylcholine symporter 1-B-like isoform X1 n=1 Tax=Haliaeetus leucocephalus TaxID=52644 RepID=UPI00053CBA2A|nr:PREDICTED: sodium-dependent lysophosphatidylcholine symporter 1-B-like isoform X1 [Haliaeetus leucocephalus]
MTGNALGFFLQIFLLDVVQLEPFHVSLIIFLGRAWDAVTDPAVGFLVSKSPRRKYGKLVPWIACSMPFGVVCYCMMWSTLSDATPTSLKFLWYLLMYSFFQTCMTCHHVPYSSLTMFLGGTQRDRDSATAYRMGMEVFSTLLGSGIQGQIVGSYHARMMNSCYVSNETLPNTSTYSLTDSLENIRRAYVFASLVLGSIYCLSCLILIFGVREEPVCAGIILIPQRRGEMLWRKEGSSCLGDPVGSRGPGTGSAAHCFTWSRSRQHTTCRATQASPSAQCKEAKSCLAPQPPGEG